MRGARGDLALSRDYAAMTLISKRYPCSSCRRHKIMREVYAFGVTERLANWDGHDIGRLQRDHVSPSSIGNGANCGTPKPGREQSVIPGWHSSTLKMPQYQ
jgi:hypothetical protein